MKYLELEKRGCEFSARDSIAERSDIGNYRLCTHDENVLLKDGRKFFFEFTACDRYAYRTTHKITGKELLHPKRDLLLPDALCVGTQWTDDLGLSWRDSKIETAFYAAAPVPYTQESILNFVNSISAEHYDAIKFI